MLDELCSEYCRDIKILKNSWFNLFHRQLILTKSEDFSYYEFIVI